MKIHLIIIFLLFQTLLYSQSIEFISVGDNDRTKQHFTNVIVSPHVNDKKAYFTRRILATEEVFDLLVKYTTENNTNKKITPENKYIDINEDIQIYEYGTYAVNVFLQDDTISYFLENGKETATYFTGLVNLLKSHGYTAEAKIYDTILLNRIKFYLDEQRAITTQEKLQTNKTWILCGSISVFACFILLFILYLCKKNRN